VKLPELFNVLGDRAGEHPIDEKQNALDWVHHIMGNVGMQHFHHADPLALLLQLLQLCDVPQKHEQTFLFVVYKCLLADQVVAAQL
jgi:hypothetical protein